MANASTAESVQGQRPVDVSYLRLCDAKRDGEDVHDEVHGGVCNISSSSSGGRHFSAD